MIFISAGHHDKDPGAIANGYRESDLTKKLRDIIVSVLRVRGLQQGTDYITDNDNESLQQYLSRIKTGDGSVVFEIHFDSGGTDATGCTMIVPKRTLTKEFEIETKFGLEIVNGCSGIMAIKNRGVKEESETHVKKLAIMRENGINGLLEVCFISNKNDLEKYFVKQNEIANHIANTLIKYDAIKN